MAAAIPAVGRTAIRNAIKAIVTNVGVSEDSSAFADGQTAIDPAGDVAASRLIKAATLSDVDGDTFDATMTINGTTEFTGKNIKTVCAMNGSARTNIITRNVRSGAIGVQSGDTFTVGVRLKTTDAS